MSTEYFNDQWRIPNNKNQSLVSNYSMEFDGTSDFVDASVASGDVVPSSQSSWTYSSWLYLDSIHTSYQCIFERGAAYPGNGMLVREDSGTIQVYAAASVVIFTNNLLPTDEWAHFALVYDISTNELTCYINNSFETVSMPAGWAISGTLFYIGKRQSNINFWNGKMDQVSVFDYALPATGTNSIATLYGGGTAVTNPMALSPKPIAYYQLGDQSVDNGANYLVPNNSLQDYVLNYGYNSTSSYTRIITNDLSSLGAISVTTWFKYNSGIPSFATILQLENNIWIPNWSSTSQIRFQGAGGTSDRHIINTTFEVDRWYHLTLTYNGTSAKCYIDGDISKGFDVIAGNLDLTSSTKFNLGSTTSSTNRWDGFISNTAMFNYELTSSQAILIYNNGTPSDLTSLNPIGWWKQNSNDIFLTNAQGPVNFNILDYGSDSNNGQMVSAVSGSLQQGNLQQTSGYSPYALDFDGINDVINCGNDSSLQITGAMTVSYWFKGQGGSGTVGGVGKLGNNGSRGFCLGMDSSGTITFFIAPTASSIISASYSHTTDTNWHHIVGVFNPSTSLELYFDGQSVDTTPTSTSSQYNASNNLQIGARGDSTGFFNGGISNVATWNTNLSSSEISEIYNQGVPSNLNTFSGTAPIAWWQLGSNSSYLADPNPNPPNVIGRWTCLDEVGTNNGESSNNMTEDAITNGVGYSGNGLGTSTIDIKGDAPYSSANGLSENMDVLDRTTDVPS